MYYCIFNTNQEQLLRAAQKHYSHCRQEFLSSPFHIMPAVHKYFRLHIKELSMYHSMYYRDKNKIHTNEIQYHIYPRIFPKDCSSGIALFSNILKMIKYFGVGCKETFYRSNFYSEENPVIH